MQHVFDWQRSICALLAATVLVGPALSVCHEDDGSAHVEWIGSSCCQVDGHDGHESSTEAERPDCGDHGDCVHASVADGYFHRSVSSKDVCAAALTVAALPPAAADSIAAFPALPAPPPMQDPPGDGALIGFRTLALIR